MDRESALKARKIGGAVLLGIILFSFILIYAGNYHYVVEAGFHASSAGAWSAQQPPFLDYNNECITLAFLLLPCVLMLFEGENNITSAVINAVAIIDVAVVFFKFIGISIALSLFDCGEGEESVGGALCTGQGLYLAGGLILLLAQIATVVLNARSRSGGAINGRAEYTPIR